MSLVERQEKLLAQTQWSCLDPKFIRVKIEVDPFGLERSTSTVFRVDTPIRAQEIKALFSRLDPVNVVPEQFGFPRPIGSPKGTFCCLTALTLHGTFDDIQAQTSMPLDPTKFPSFDPVAKALAAYDGDPSDWLR